MNALLMHNYLLFINIRGYKKSCVYVCLINLAEIVSSVPITYKFARGFPKVKYK